MTFHRRTLIAGSLGVPAAAWWLAGPSPPELGRYRARA